MAAIKRFFNRLFLVAISFAAGMLFYRWASLSGNGETFPLADGTTEIPGRVLENVGFQGHHVVLFRPEGYDKNLYVIPKYDYRAGDYVEMSISPVTIAELQKFEIRYYEQVGGK